MSQQRKDGGQGDRVGNLQFIMFFVGVFVAGAAVSLTTKVGGLQDRLGIAGGTWQQVLFVACVFIALSVTPYAIWRLASPLVSRRKDGGRQHCGDAGSPKC